MWRVRILSCALLFCLGCTSGGESGQWDEFWKDLRGDNVKMRYDFSGNSDLENASTPIKRPD